jgi:hypothetical protein
MNDPPGSNLPGIVVIELDVDDNIATGGTTGLAQLLDACELGDKIKLPVSGFDIAIVLMLRDQGDDALSAWCSNCFSVGQCFIKNVPCPVGCGTPDCYQGINACVPGDANCYLADTMCQPILPLCSSCYEMTVMCPDYVPCGMGRIRGEWYALTSIPAGEPVERGRFMMPLPKETDSDNNDCYTFPWKMIVYAAYDALAGHAKQFNLNNAKDPANLRWQISTWYDTSYALTGNDFIDLSVCAEVTDVIPNTAKASAIAATGDFCNGDFDCDADVDGSDAYKFKVDFGRSDCPICPTDPWCVYP